MLKSINNLFEKRKNYLSKSQDKLAIIKTSFYSFLKNKFGDDIMGFSFVLNYDAKENSLTINTDNKVIANELTLQLLSINSFFKENKIKLNKILIR
ncbi:MAG: hypothetical protein A3B86_04495 [Candidatus Yanofskybacteria bacterium RIFCSPHIGHO2_02_FULL_38_22b]|uniref:DUF721 domain-containing protein n=1 Tax=Candidatus Yanofskybacteria bacterium RIFCSPHIGHO2_02_FULL_38_22b TaxID=1802673 RepID=A0A1F8F236_9BACT|nr:MAG: hypothetical protein A2816_02265 [Candidatus Yanofskybacteria bacterium RIFCSPHIGHO2_01_FULL_39_44]OGN06339.1 MAG: hypothetical protein A3B86_04495 [Candidatus Yanofskybacteria bacterium RIFCSPHIGHO2_02_FULL_38_22b]OGN19757.1 MAG: hypothetical protein A2910_04230 [Candidatus Yanofskybacteria bacterium RIFCSPLOWO2_01_FULL_39_28]